MFKINKKEDFDLIDESIKKIVITILCSTTDISNLPRNLEKLEIFKFDEKINFKYLPPKLKSLTTYQELTIEQLKNIPKSILSLQINNEISYEINSSLLPPNLISLSICCNKLIKNLPNTLKQLYLSDCVDIKSCDLSLLELDFCSFTNFYKEDYVSFSLDNKLNSKIISLLFCTHYDDIKIDYDCKNHNCDILFVHDSSCVSDDREHFINFTNLISSGIKYVITDYNTYIENLDEFKTSPINFLSYRSRDMFSFITTIDELISAGYNSDYIVNNTIKMLLRE